MKWKINFDINNSNFNMVGYCAHGFIKCIPKKDDEQLFKEWYLVHEKGRTFSYVPSDMIKEVVKWLNEKIIAEPQWANDLHLRGEEYNADYFHFAKRVAVKDLNEVSNGELLDLYKDIKAKQFLGHTYAIATTWFLDCDGEVYSNYLKNELKKCLQNLNINDPVKVVEYFVMLTTPTKESLAQKEQLEFLELVKIAKSDVSEETKQLAIEKHYNNWCWTPYSYVGPAYDMDHYAQEVKNNLSIKNLSELIDAEKNRNQNIKVEQEKIIKNINLPENLQHYFSIARDIIWLKDYRKYCIWHGHYVLDKITKEIAKRLSISHRQANYFLTEEVGGALLKGKYDENVLNQRYQYCVIWADENGQKIYYGDKAKKVIANLDLEEEVISNEDGFRGTCAYPGKVSGRVKIVNSVNDIKKMEVGDIMLSLTTYPAFLPAMKKAVAIVTEDGGITCHAAIVARELKIPCMVGVKNITKLLKDGDRIEIDATGEMIKRI